MKYLFLAFFFFALSLHAQERTVCGDDDKMGACRMSYRVLSGIARSQENGSAPRDMDLRSLERSLRSKQVKVDESQYRSMKSDGDRGNYLFQKMQRESGMSLRSLNETEMEKPSESMRMDQGDSGTRGGGFQLPEAWWLWY